MRSARVPPPSAPPEGAGQGVRPVPRPSRAPTAEASGAAGAAGCAVLLRPRPGERRPRPRARRRGGRGAALDVFEKEPIDAEGIGYVSHPYPMKVGAPYEKNWERDFGFVADKYPVFATEIGYQLATDKGAHIPVIDDGKYGKRITDYFASKGISWVAWVFDPQWSPQLIKDYETYEPTMQGKHFRDVMLRENKK